MIAAFRQIERALIDVAPRPAGGQGDFADSVFHRYANERIAQQLIDVGIGGFDIGRRRDDDDDLAARLGIIGIVSGERCQIAAPDFLVKLGQFAAD